MISDDNTLSETGTSEDMSDMNMSNIESESARSRKARKWTRVVVSTPMRATNDE